MWGCLTDSLTKYLGRVGFCINRWPFQCMNSHCTGKGVSHLSFKMRILYNIHIVADPGHQGTRCEQHSQGSWQARRNLIIWQYSWQIWFREWMNNDMHMKMWHVIIYSCLYMPNFNDDLAESPLSWWRHQMETFTALLILCAGNSPVTGEFPSERPVTRSFAVFFDLRLNNAWVSEG